ATRARTGSPRAIYATTHKQSTARHPGASPLPESSIHPRSRAPARNVPTVRAWRYGAATSGPSFGRRPRRRTASGRARTTLSRSERVWARHLGSGLPQCDTRGGMAELPHGTITSLFTDIEGSTRLLKQLGERYGTARGDH